MKINNFKLLLLITFIFFYNCKNENPLIKDFTSSEIPISSNSDFEDNIFNIIDALDITQLKHKDSLNFIFNTIKKAIATEDAFYLKSSNDKIYLVKKNGVLQKVLNSRGLGPNEYREIKDFDINDNELFIYDFQKQRFLVYDLQFNYLRTENIGLNFMSFKFDKKNLVLFTAKHRNKINDSVLDYDFLVLDKDFNIRTKVAAFDASKYETIRIHTNNPFHLLENKIIFNDLISDTIYKISSDKVKSFKYFKYENETLKEEFKNESHRFILDELNNNSETFNKLDFFASLKGINKDNLAYNFSRGGKESIYSFINLSDNTTKNYKFPSGFNTSDYKNIFEIKTSDNEEFISIVYPYVLRFLKNQYIEKYKKEDEFTKKIDHILEGTTDDGNQIILKYKIKNSN